ncbi:TniQ family protein [Comamonas terrigena]|uniref:TniQ family protein n=1 Tax=Comamonas terrigena TaxID=32013 RepID=UPI003C798FD0
MDKNGRLGPDQPTRLKLPVWPFQVLPWPDELLSSFLCRAALVHASSAYEFAALYFGRHVWTRDIDRTVPQGLLEQVAHFAQLSQAQCINMLLDRGVVKNMPLWVSNVGVYHRIRRCHGLKFCALCLRERAYFQRLWRYAWVGFCPHHEVLLHDACPHCDAPVAPHRSRSLALCWVCKRCLFTSAPPVEAPRLHLLWQLRLSMTLLEGGPATVFPGPGTVHEFVHVARLVEVAVRESGQGVPDLFDTASSIRAPGCARVQDIRQRAVFQNWLSGNWPHGFQILGNQCHWTQARFGAAGIPAWFGTQVAQLPPGRRRVCPPGELQRRLARLQRRKPPQWRAQRAELLMNAARGLRLRALNTAGPLTGRARKARNNDNGR